MGTRFPIKIAKLFKGRISLGAAGVSAGQDLNKRPPGWGDIRADIFRPTQGRQGGVVSVYVLEISGCFVSPP